MGPPKQEFAPFPWVILRASPARGRACVQGVIGWALPAQATQAPMNTKTLALLLAAFTPLAPLLPQASAAMQVGGPSDPVMLFECGESEWFLARGWRLVLCDQVSGPDLDAAYVAFEAWLAQRVDCPGCVGSDPLLDVFCRAYADTGTSVIVTTLGGDCFAYSFESDVHLAGCTACPY
jgi:hypothetical protein